MFEYAHIINREIIKFLIRSNLNLVDIYLVGSRVLHQIENKDKDYDFLIILEKSTSIYELKERRLQLEQIVLEHDALGLYHFKLLDIAELEKLSSYDGFRLHEFQSANTSINQSGVIYRFHPMLDRKNFSNSLLIQYVYGRLSNRSFFFNCEEDNKIEYRFKKNNQILAQNRLEIFYDKFTDMYDEDFLWDKLNKLDANGRNWDDFLTLYFSKYRHEFINKEPQYRNNLLLFTL